MDNWKPQKLPYIVFCPNAKPHGAAWLFDSVDEDGIYSERNAGNALIWLNNVHGKYCGGQIHEHFISEVYDPFEMSGI